MKREKTGEEKIAFAVTPPLYSEHFTTELLYHVLYSAGLHQILDKILHELFSK